MQIKTTGLDELINHLNDLQENLTELENTTSVSFGELFIPEFMQKYTSFNSFDDLLTAGGFEVNSQEDFKAIPDDVFDEHIAKHTNFSSWDEMLGTAGTEYASRKLGF